MKRVYLDRMNMQEWQAEGNVEMNALFRAGAAATFTTDVAMLTGGNHTTFEQFLQSKKWYFKGNLSSLVCILPASGRVGSATLKALMEDRFHPRIRALVRTVERRAEIESIYGANASLEIVLGDFENENTIREALVGVDSVILIPPEKLERFSLIDHAIKIAHEQGVSHSILFSASSALGPTAMGTKFRAWERVLRRNSSSWTVLQSTLFFDLMFSFANAIKTPLHHVHHWLGNGKFCPVDSRDVGDACQVVLREGPLEHHGRTYVLCGPQAVNFNEMCEILSSIVGFQIRTFPDVTLDQVRDLMEDKLPSFNIEEVIQAQEAITNCNDVEANTDLLKLVGCARPLRQFFEDYKSKFLPSYEMREEQQRMPSEQPRTTEVNRTVVNIPGFQLHQSNQFQQQEQSPLQEKLEQQKAFGEESRQEFIHVIRVAEA